MAQTSERQYAVLERVLDNIRAEAPKGSIYQATSPEAATSARARAFIHLFLKARFGMTNFDERENQITDGPHDGGIDAYKIDAATRKVVLIQSKFRATARNFNDGVISADEIVKMEVKSILKGEKTSESGEKYNERILKFQAAIRATPNIGSYDHSVVILGNVKLTEPRLRKIVGEYEIDLYDCARTYRDLVFPITTGTYYSDPDLVIEIQRYGRTSDSHLDYDLTVRGVPINVKLLYVPTSEIARIMGTYKNSILSYNPRSYLEIEKNSVNREIAESLKRDTSNEFALFNNGITMVSDQTSVSTNTGKIGRTQVILRSPQLINGAQTAYSLSEVYEKHDQRIFKGKEVLLRVITFRNPSRHSKLRDPVREDLISRISRASNLQTRVDDADRRSNDAFQIELQRRFFEEHGLFYERKRGEFHEGLADGYIIKSDMINRERLLRIALASMYRVRQAQSSVAKFFKGDELKEILRISDVAKYVFGYQVHDALSEFRLRSSDPIERFQIRRFGDALRYGRLAAVCAAVNAVNGNYKYDVHAVVEKILKQWRAFERKAKGNQRNRLYVEGRKLDAVRYYKGNTVDEDLRSYAFHL